MGLMSQETLGSHELGEPGVSRVTIFPGFHETRDPGVLGFRTEDKRGEQKPN